jgi:hypothetical protein
MLESPISKAKDFSVKFPREIIERAHAAFMQETGLLSSSEQWISILTIETDGETWNLSNHEAFLSEYTRDISSATMIQTYIVENNKPAFEIRFRHDYSVKPTTTIRITLNSRAAIDRIFQHFQDFFDHESLRDDSSLSQPVISSYTLARRLPSTSINPQTLQKIETLLIRLSGELESEYMADRECKVEISIEESQGCESLQSITQHQRDYFPDDTKRISIRLNLRVSNLLRIQFDKDRKHTIIEVTRHSQNPRSEARKIVDEVLHILEDYKNGNWFLNPPLLISIFIFYLSCTLLGLAIAVLRVRPAIAAGALFSVVGINLYLSLYKFKPYSQFLTKRNERIAKWFNWFVFASIEFLLFSVAAAAILSKLPSK